MNSAYCDFGHTNPTLAYYFGLCVNRDTHAKEHVTVMFVCTDFNIHLCVSDMKKGMIDVGIFCREPRLGLNTEKGKCNTVTPQYCDYNG